MRITETTNVESNDDTCVASADGISVPDVDVNEFKAALGSFATGVTLATTASGLELHGVTANAVMSVSLEPPLVLLSIQTGTRMYTALRFSDNFALSVLTKAQRDIAMYFADSTQPHGTGAFARVPYFLGRTGAPLLEGALAHVECVIVEAHPAGDHTLYIGRAVHVESFEGPEPLLYFRGTLD